MKRHLGTVILVVVAAALGLLLLRDRGSVSQTERSLRKDSVFPAWRREELSRIELEGQGPRLSLERSGDTWKMHAPVEGPADGAQVELLVAALERGSVIRRVEPGAATGLGAPRLRGWITMGKASLAFALGATSPQPEGSAYFQIEGEAPIVIGASMVRELTKGADRYRDRTVISFSPGDVASLELSGGGERTALVREGALRFRVEPDRRFASRSAVEGLFGALAEVRAESFPGEPEAEAAERSPRLVVTLRPRDDARKTATLSFGAACEGHPDDVVVVRAGPARLAACVPRGAFERLSPDRSRLADASLFYARPDEVEELLVARGAERLDLARKGPGFRLRAPEGRDLSSDEAESAQALLAAIVGGKGTITAEEPAGPPVAEIALRYGGQEEKVFLSRAREGAILALRADGARLALPPALAARLTPPRVALRGARLFPDAQDRVVRGYTLACEGLTQEVARDQGYRLVHPAGLAIDGASAANTHDALVRARAERWVADRDDGSFGLGPGCSARVSFDDDAGPPSIGLRLGRPTEGGVFGSIDGDPAVFVAPPSLAALVRRPLVSRDAFRLVPEEITRLVLSAGSLRRTISFARDRDGGQDALRDSLGALVPLFAVHLGRARAGEGLDAPLLITVELSGDAGQRSRRIRIGSDFEVPEGKVVYAEIEGENAVFAVRAELVAPLRAALDRR